MDFTTALPEPPLLSLPANGTTDIEQDSVVLYSITPGAAYYVYLSTTPDETGRLIVALQ